MKRETITDITTNDKVYLQTGHQDGVALEPAEAMVLARELVTHAMTLTAPDYQCEIDITIKVEA